MERTLREKVIDGLVWSAARTWGAKLLTLGLFIVMSRLLGPHEFGVFAAAVAVLSFVQLFVDQGLAEAIVQRREITNAQLNTVFALNLAASLVLVGALWVSAPYIAFKVDAEELTTVLRVASFSVPLTALGLVQVAMNRRGFHFKTLALRTMVATVVSGVAAIALALAGQGIWALVAQFIVQAGVGTLVLWMRPQWKPSWRFDARGLGQLLSYALHRLGTNLLHYGNTKYVELFIAATLGAPALGVYLVGVRIYESLLQMLSGAVLEVAHSGFSRLAGEPARLRAAYYRAMKVTSAIGVPIFVLVGVLAEPIILSFFGPKWASSVRVTEMMALLGAVQVLQFYNGTVYNALGKPVIGLVFNLCKLVLTFAVLWSVGGWSLDRVIAAYVAVQLAVALPSFVLLRRFAAIGLRGTVAAVWPFLLGCAITAAVVAAVMHTAEVRAQPAWAELLVGLALAAVVYPCCVALFARQDFLAAYGAVARRVFGVRHAVPPR
jgi:O-antigen/teichoic acid export membrane protein